MNRMWITGFRDYELGIFNNKDPKLTVINYALNKILTNAINDGCEWLITGGQLGVEQWAIEQALQLKETTFPEFKIAMMTPFIDFGKNWKENKQIKLNALKEGVDFNSSVLNTTYKNPQQLKDYQNFMLAHTEHAVSFYDTEVSNSRAKFEYNAMQFHAKNHEYPVSLIDFERLQEYADEYQLEINDY